MCDLISLQHQAVKPLGIERTEKQVSFPRFDAATGVERKSRRGEGFVPPVHWRGNAGGLLADTDKLVGIILPAESDLGPAVIVPRLSDIELFATTGGAVIDGP